MLRIRAIASHVPDTTPFRAVQAQEKNIGYGHLLYKSAVFSMPRARGRVDAEEALRLLPTASIALPVAPPLQSGADLALEAIAQLRQQIPAETLAQVTHIVVTNAALNQRINESVAGRIQHALGLPKALPFAIGQAGTAGVFNALSMIEALVSLGGSTPSFAPGVIWWCTATAPPPSCSMAIVSLHQAGGRYAPRPCTMARPSTIPGGSRLPPWLNACIRWR